MTHNDCGTASVGRFGLSREGAIDLLLSRVEPIADTETIATEAGLGRVLATSVTSGIPVPGWDNSARDGYAIRYADLASYGGQLRIEQRIPAGKIGMPLEPGTAARIFTGAPVPVGADTVAVQEICKRAGDRVDIPMDCKRGANIRRAGEDVPAGSEVITTGTRLAPQHLGLAASVGAADLVVASGGVSVGEEDHLKPAVEQLGRLDFWNILIRPGKPVAFGCVDGTPFFGSPGNPVAISVTFCLFARPLVLRLKGTAGDLSPRRVSVRAVLIGPSPIGAPSSIALSCRPVTTEPLY
ncbi:MAG: molybdopterin molybdotransferase MoeA [Thiohalocapsa sp.]